jgi:hypothetical protein
VSCRSPVGQKGADFGTKLVAELLQVKGCLILAFSSVCRVIGPTVGLGGEWNYTFCLAERID